MISKSMLLNHHQRCISPGCSRASPNIMSFLWKLLPSSEFPYLQLIPQIHSSFFTQITLKYSLDFPLLLLLTPQPLLPKFLQSFPYQFPWLHFLLIPCHLPLPGPCPNTLLSPCHSLSLKTTKQQKTHKIIAVICDLQIKIQSPHSGI